jgi:hypothetical protein
MLSVEVLEARPIQEEILDGIESIGFRDGMLGVKRDRVKFKDQSYFVGGFSGQVSTAYSYGWSLGSKVEWEEFGANFYHVGWGTVQHDGKGWIAKPRKDLLDVKNRDHWIGSTLGVYPRALGRFETLQKAVESLKDLAV